MNAILAMPIELRMALLFVVGAAVGALANFAAAVYSSSPQDANPWIDGRKLPPGRRWLRRVPILGWFVPVPGQTVSTPLRPPVVEIVSGALLAWLCWWETAELALVPAAIKPLLPPDWAAIVHAQYFAHALLVSVMLIASLIDLDEKIIPDSITIPGTWLGLCVAALCPTSLLPDWPPVGFLRLASPQPWPMWLDGAPQVAALAIALACWTAWVFALLPRTWYTRHGLVRAAALCMARCRREPATLWLGAMFAAGIVPIVLLWLQGGPHWDALLTALMGMAGGGAMIWSVRAVGFIALRREAMGFGDVTLMAMIGCFLGWQACLMIFFLAPLVGLVVGGVQWIVARDSEIPYGPFLCLAALAVVIRWADLWPWLADVLLLGRFVPLMLAACLLLMIVLLRAMRTIREHFEK